MSEVSYDKMGVLRWPSSTLWSKDSSPCGGTGTDTTLPTNTVQVPITTGTVTDSGSEYTGFIGVISQYIYKAGKL